MKKSRNKNLNPLSAAAVRWRCDPTRFPFMDTSEVEPLNDIIGQDRALRSLKLGLELNSPGYNVFVCGLKGSGRTSTLQWHLRRERPFCPLAKDRAYVYRFRDPFHPRLLTLSRGHGVPLARDVDNGLVELIRKLPALLRSDQVKARLEELMRNVEEMRKADREVFDDELAKEGFSLLETRQGEMVRAVIRVRVQGHPEPVTEEELRQAAAAGLVDDATLESLGERFQEYGEKLQNLARVWRSREVQVAKDAGALRSEVCTPLLDSIRRELSERYSGDGLEEYLDDLMENLLDHLVALLQLADGLPEPPEAMTADLEQALYRYRVNVVLDNRVGEGCPVVVETQPTYTTLFGGVERTGLGDDLPDDFHALRAGSLLEADGGYLVMNAQDLLREPGVWGRLKSTLRDRLLEIPETDPDNRRTTFLKPEPIHINLKVVLVGSFDTYMRCLEGDPDFQQIFKVRVDFDHDVPVTDDLVENKIPGLISKICHDEELRPLQREAVSSVVERAVRWGGRQDRVTTVFTDLADLVREANYWAGQRGGDVVSRDDVTTAIVARRDRLSLPEESNRRRILEGTILLDLDGRAVGQINGLVVRTIGREAFGLPVRISARVGMGSDGVIDIEREVGLSGSSHDKGVQILSGYLRGQYARNQPLSLAASICFEQSYGGVDGDSASSTELYAILSAIAEVPLRQDLAVTGSVNQLGEVQAVGGLNEKIEGFFRVAEAMKFPGKPGVVIPRSCVPELMLSDAVVDAVERGTFRVYAISHVDEGIELLTGEVAGVRGSDGQFPEATLHGRVQRRLAEFAADLTEFKS